MSLSNLPFKEKSFECELCGSQYYTDMEQCTNCRSENALKPIEKDLYKLLLNGKVYGCGNIYHIHSLIRDYVLVNELYGKTECEFKILKLKSQSQP